MKIGDLVRVKPPVSGRFADGTSPYEGETDWIGIIMDFRIGDSHLETPDCSYAIVFWNERFPEEEEYLDQIEVVS